MTAKIGELLQMVSVEIGLGCNLAADHPQCPNALGVDRYDALPSAPLLDDAVIVELYRALAQEYGFAGWVNFSFYNEPLLRMDRLFALIPQIAAVVPDASFMLITNGTLLPDDLEPFRAFRGIWITDYGDRWTPDPAKVATLKALIGEPSWRVRRERPSGVFVSKGRLDQRRKGPGKDRSEKPCVLPFKDLAFDAFGHAHLCCIDWRGEANLGNVVQDGLAHVLARWEAVVRSIVGPTMTDDAPDSCRHCRFTGFQRLDYFDPAARLKAAEWLVL